MRWKMQSRMGFRGRTETIGVGETEGFSVIKTGIYFVCVSGRMIVCIEWAHCVKPGGTAGFFLSQQIFSAGAFFLLFAPTDFGKEKAI